MKMISNRQTVPNWGKCVLIILVMAMVFAVFTEPAFAKKKHKHHMVKSKSGIYTVEKCRSCGKKKIYLKKSIPSYWSKNIVNALKKANRRAYMPGYVFVTDPHWDMSAKHSPAIASYLTKKMNYRFAVCGGDVIATHQKSRSAAISELNRFYNKFTVPVLSVEGNHDNNKNSNTKKSSYLSSGEVADIINSRAPEGMFMDLNGDITFIDDTENNVRYITFLFDDTAYVSDDVVNYINELVCELDDSWDVVLFSHAYWHYKRPGKKCVPVKYGKDLARKLLEIQNHSVANIALWHVGHIHRDQHEYLKNADGTQLLVVSTNCDSCEKSKKWGGLNMKKGTHNEQVLEIVQLDKESKTVYMTRVGAGKSRVFTAPRKQISEDHPEDEL